MQSFENYMRNLPDNDFTIQSNKVQAIYGSTMSKCELDENGAGRKWQVVIYVCSGAIISAPEFTSIFICSFAYLRFIQSSTQFLYASLF